MSNTPEFALFIATLDAQDGDHLFEEDLQALARQEAQTTDKDRDALETISANVWAKDLQDALDGLTDTADDPALEAAASATEDGLRCPTHFLLSI